MGLIAYLGTAVHHGPRSQVRRSMSGQKKTPGPKPQGVVRGPWPGLAVRVSVGLDPEPHPEPRHYDAVVAR